MRKKEKMCDELMLIRGYMTLAKAFLETPRACVVRCGATLKTDAHTVQQKAWGRYGVSCLTHPSDSSSPSEMRGRHHAPIQCNHNPGAFHSILCGSEGGFLSSFIDSSAVCPERETVLLSTPRQVEAAGFTGRCVHLQIHSLSQVRISAIGRSGTGKLSTSSARRSHR